jgi:hypothetical protein
MEVIGMWGSESDQVTFGAIWPFWYAELGLRNRRRAVQLLRPLAGQGYAPAQFALGWAYFDGDGVRKDYVQSFKHFMAAAEQAYPSAEGMVGNFYITVKPAYNVCAYDPVVGARWHLHAAEHGNAGAQYNLALSYWIERGVDRNPLLAYVWASLSMHCSPIVNRMASVLRDQAVQELSQDQIVAADNQIAEMSLHLPKPWSEHSGYWRKLAELAGKIE